MTQLEQVRAKIIEAVPEIETDVNQASYIVGHGIHRGLRRYCGSEAASRAWRAIDEMPNDEWDCLCLETAKLLRPITLADVLRAVAIATPFKMDVVCEGQTTLYVRDRNLYASALRFGESFLDKLDKKTGGQRGVKWNLGFSLDGQEPEVITFLSSLLLDK